MNRFLATFALLLASSALAAQDLAGLWTISTNMGGNESYQECKFIVIANKITGTCNLQDKDLQVTGTVDGKKVTWQYKNEMYGATLTFNYSGKIDDLGRISGIF